MAFFKVDIDKVRGKTVKLSAKVKGENISKPDKPYLGIKMMMTVTMADGRIDYPDTTRLTGDFGWRELKTVTTVPPDAEVRHHPDRFAGLDRNHLFLGPRARRRGLTGRVTLQRKG